MTMSFTPRSEEYLEEEAKKRGPWPNGVYSFEVIHAEDQTSKKTGNPMIYLEMNIFNDGMEKKTIKDYLVSAMEFKLRHACETCGILDRYETGALSADDFIGRSGMVKLGIERGTPPYADKNIVRDYEVSKALGRPAGADQRPEPPINDDIPF